MIYLRCHRTSHHNFLKLNCKFLLNHQSKSQKTGICLYLKGGTMKRINELLPISFLMIDYLTYCFSSGHVEIIVPSTPLKVLSMENQSEGSFLGFYQLIIFGCLLCLPTQIVSKWQFIKYNHEHYCGSFVESLCICISLLKMSRLFWEQLTAPCVRQSLFDS